MEITVEQSLQQSDALAAAFCDEDGHFRFHEHVVGFAAEENTGGPALSAAAHHHEVRARGSGHAFDRVRYVGPLFKERPDGDPGRVQGRGEALKSLPFPARTAAWTSPEPSSDGSK